ncbi:hypothetical protein CCR75_002045 [Bremia lactucae]|uniref:NAD(P)H-hydrate epimerase n=1 Tax=Bremia lactucae TaxID=4779 RepID=A0A976IBN9_BRELC|nr:hypothetical protein CCR75_002045 [Bremia lactucae]
MSATHGFSIDQLMELAGLSVAAAVGKEFHRLIKQNGAINENRRLLVVAGPGNNGGDALVAARHLVRLVTQCEQLNIPIAEHIQDASIVDASYDVILDGIFGFSFSGNIRPPFDHIVKTLQNCQTPIVSIDIPSAWHVEKGVHAKSCFQRFICNLGNENGFGLEPQMLISLTAPKLCARYFIGPNKVHYVGGRFVPKSLAEEFDLELPIYPSFEQCVKLPIPY